mmetsp:Transcript_35799/g.79664  ORF Transcript_35799/g.79664 Transcript_35799/m.79664 type:complete len:313 (-) Transcript_35799:486-1424(-)
MDSNCLQKVDARFQIELHPSKLHNVEDGVDEQMNNLLLRYNEEFEGIVMAYSNVTSSNKAASIHPYFPFVHLDVRAQLLLFKPVVGNMLVGEVIKVGADFIGLLVLGVLNASIAAESIHSEFKCSLQNQSWSSTKEAGHVIQVGTLVKFEVVKMQEQAGFFTIYGSLLKRGTGALDQVRAAGAGAEAEEPASGGKALKNGARKPANTAVAGATGATNGKKSKGSSKAAADGDLLSPPLNKGEAGKHKDKSQKVGMSPGNGVEAAGKSEKKREKKEKKRGKEDAGAKSEDDTAAAGKHQANSGEKSSKKARKQ